MKLLAIVALFSLVACARNPIEPMSERSVKVQTGYAPVNGLKLYYEIHESIDRLRNPVPLLLLHGGGSTIESNFSTFLPLLTQHRRVIAMEEQGHGHTAAIARPFTFDHSAGDAAALLDFLRIEKADVMGFSNGGTVALRLAHLYPGKVNKLVVASAQYRRDGMVKGFWDGMNKATIASMPVALLDADRKINPDPKHQEQLFFQDSRRMQGFRDIPDCDITSIAAPSLILIGDRDVVTVEHASKMASLIPQGRLTVVPGTHGSYLGEIAAASGHSALPEATAMIVTEFLDLKQ